MQEGEKVETEIQETSEDYETQTNKTKDKQKLEEEIQESMNSEYVFIENVSENEEVLEITVQLAQQNIENKVPENDKIKSRSIKCGEILFTFKILKKTEKQNDNEFLIILRKSEEVNILQTENEEQISKQKHSFDESCDETKTNNPKNYNNKFEYKITNNLIKKTNECVKLKITQNNKTKAQHSKSIDELDSNHRELVEFIDESWKNVINSSSEIHYFAVDNSKIKNYFIFIKKKDNNVDIFIENNNKLNILI